MRKILLLATICFSALAHLKGQEARLPDIVTDYLENNIENISLGSLESLYDNLLYYNKHPMDLNKVDYEDLTQLHLLTDLQIHNILLYRDLVGDFYRLEELQAVPGLHLTAIRRIVPFLTIKSKGSKVNIWDKIFHESTRTLFIRYARDFPLRDGYLGDEPAFEGSPDQLYTRLRWRAGTDFSAGITMEKDPGEAFFTGSNPYGFDYYSAHFWLQRNEKFVKTIAIGDYNINLGQGLIRHSAFGGGKSSFVMGMNKRGKKLVPYGSVDENNFLRGVASELNITENLSLLLAASYRKRDANQVLRADTFVNRQERFISSLQTSGLHRTESEIADEDGVSQTSLGASLTWDNRKYEISINAWYDKLSDSLGVRPSPSNLYRFSGRELLNVSIDYQYRLRKFLLFGESAMSNNGGNAHILGILTALHPKLDLGLLFRYLSKDYQSLYPNAFAENSRAQNEHGVYLSLIYRISPKWTLSAYQDIWAHPWLRYRVDAPSEGNEEFLRIKYYDKHYFEAYFQFKNKTRKVNTLTLYNRDIIQAETRRSIRFHFSYPITKEWQWRTRIEMSQFLTDGKTTSHGYMIYTDFNYRPMGFPLSFTSRIAYYQTDDYDSRIYAYENNVLYAFSIPAYYSTGIRTYLNLRWKVYHNLTIEARYALTYRPYDASISSSYNEIHGNKSHEFKAQIRIRF